MKRGEYSVNCKTLEDTDELAKRFVNSAKDGCFTALYGEIGAGKTAFVRYAAQAAGVREKVTSPSFTVLNEYHTGIIPIYHFDLYRLENAGIKTILDELREYSCGKFLTFVEWAEFSQGEIPFERIEIKITINDDESRCFTFEAYGEKEKNILEGIRNC